MQIFSKKEAQKNPNVILAALKLIEMMSIVQLEEFYINQWVFVFDCKICLLFVLIILDFGLDITQRKIEEKPPQEIVESEDTVIVEQTQQRPHISGFIFQPYVTYSLEDNLKIDYTNKVTETQKDYDKLERKIVMTMTSVRGSFI